MESFENSGCNESLVAQGAGGREYPRAGAHHGISARGASESGPTIHQQLRSHRGQHFCQSHTVRPHEDLDTYPRDLEADQRTLEQLGVDALFLPTAEDMYPEGFQTYVHVEEITDKLCGKSRRELFRGVTTIVLKLFNIVQPHSAFFGEKDRQQLEVIRKMVADLNLDVEIVGLPIIREPDGLAMSSRNQISGKGRAKNSTIASRGITTGSTTGRTGGIFCRHLRSRMRNIIEREGQAQVDYISVCDPQRFEELEEVRGKAMIALAVHVGKARLIDNCLIERI